MVALHIQYFEDLHAQYLKEFVGLQILYFVLHNMQTEGFVVLHNSQIEGFVGPHSQYFERFVGLQIQYFEGDVGLVVLKKSFLVRNKYNLQLLDSTKKLES